MCVCVCASVWGEGKGDRQRIWLPCQPIVCIWGGGSMAKVAALYTTSVACELPSWGGYATMKVWYFWRHFSFSEHSLCYNVTSNVNTCNFEEITKYQVGSNGATHFAKTHPMHLMTSRSNRPPLDVDLDWCIPTNDSYEFIWARLLAIWTCRETTFDRKRWGNILHQNNT